MYFSGTGMTLFYLRSQNLHPTWELPRSAMFKLTGVVLSLVMIQLLERVPLPQSPPWRFYCLAFVRCFSLPWIVVILVWKICDVISGGDVKMKSR